MNHPSSEIRGVVRELCQPDSKKALQAVDKYFSPDSQIIYPLFNSPKGSGIAGVKAAYQMLRVLTYGNTFEFHSVAFDRIEPAKGGLETQKGLIAFTEKLKLRFPLPDALVPWMSFSFITHITLVKNPSTELWMVQKQEDVLSGVHLLPGDTAVVNGIKYLTGVGTLLVGGAFQQLKFF